MSKIEIHLVGNSSVTISRRSDYEAYRRNEFDIGELISRRFYSRFAIASGEPLVLDTEDLGIDETVRIRIVRETYRFCKSITEFYNPNDGDLAIRQKLNRRKNRYWRDKKNG